MVLRTVGALGASLSTLAIGLYGGAQLTDPDFTPIPSTDICPIVRSSDYLPQPADYVSLAPSHAWSLFPVSLAYELPPPPEPIVCWWPTAPDPEFLYPEAVREDLVRTVRNELAEQVGAK